MSTGRNPSARPALFLDKDGTLVEDVPYNVDPSRIRLVPGAAEALRALVTAGYLPVVVSNQSGVARGLFGIEDLFAVERRLARLLRAHGVPLGGFYFCPHHPEGTVPGFDIDCGCRKPRPGLIERAANDLGIDLTASWMVGDILDDVEAGNRAGCSSALIHNGGETEWRPGDWRTPSLTAPDLKGAAQAILGRGQLKGAGTFGAGPNYSGASWSRARTPGSALTPSGSDRPGDSDPRVGSGTWPERGS